MARILLADRCTDTVESLALLLRFWGHEPRVVYDGPAVLEAVHDFQPDLVLMDIALPRMDGFKVARCLRQQPGLGGLPLVALTGFDGSAYRRAAYEAGFDFYLLKPLAPEDLRAMLEAFADEACAPEPAYAGVS